MTCVKEMFSQFKCANKTLSFVFKQKMALEFVSEYSMLVKSFNFSLVYFMIIKFNIRLHEKGVVNLESNNFMEETLQSLICYLVKA